ncbi:hypothetical protein B0H13DRAFT_1716031 [Mycena leptocephala]|nr:hypothetical protein B0H13DRAFT_1716031 [Mycena leptocephala]
MRSLSSSLACVVVDLRIWAQCADSASSQRIPPSATASTNMGLICSAMGDHQKALRRFTDATTRDPFLTIAYFQRGVSHFLLERYRPAGRDFKRAWLSLRGNEAMFLGLRFRLFASEVLFNLGLSRIRLGRMEKGMEYLEKAKLLTMIEDHDVIEDVILHKGEGFTVFSIAPGILYWPSDTKLMGIERKDFMGKATLIAASDPDDLTTGFSGLQLKQQRKQKNLNRESEAVIARRVTLVSICAYFAPSVLFISIPFLLFIPPLHLPAPSSSPAYIVSPGGFRTLFLVSCSAQSTHSHHVFNIAAPSVPPLIQVTDTSTNMGADKPLPGVDLRPQHHPVPVDAEVRLP